PLGNTFVKDVNSLSAAIAVTTQITKGAAGGTDFVSENLLTISSVWDTSITYTQGTAENDGMDYYIEGNNVKWETSAPNQPGTGDSYNISYTYSTTLTQGVRIKTMVTAEAITKGSPNGTDNLANNDIIGIASVNSLANGTGTAYVEGVDFTLVDGQNNTNITIGKIDWSLAGSEPSPASTYYVTYTYWDHTVEGDYICAGSYQVTDESASVEYNAYNSIKSYNGVNLRDAIDFRHFVGATPNVPVSGTYLDIDYDYYIPRKDILVLGTNGFLQIISGTPGITPTLPNIPSNTMAIAEID